MPRERSVTLSVSGGSIAGRAQCLEACKDCLVPLSHGWYGTTPPALPARPHWSPVLFPCTVNRTQPMYACGASRFPCATQSPTCMHLCCLGRGRGRGRGGGRCRRLQGRGILGGKKHVPHIPSGARTSARCETITTERNHRCVSPAHGPGEIRLCRARLVAGAVVVPTAYSLAPLGPAACSLQRRAPERQSTAHAGRSRRLPQATGKKAKDTGRRSGPRRWVVVSMCAYPCRRPRRGLALPWRFFSPWADVGVPEGTQQLSWCTDAPMCAGVWGCMFSFLLLVRQGGSRGNNNGVCRTLVLCPPNA